MNEQVFEAAGVLSGSNKNSGLKPGHFGEALVSPEVVADKESFGMQCRFCGFRHLFCTSCGAKFSVKTEFVYTSIDGHSQPDIAKDSEGQENESTAVIRAQRGYGKCMAHNMQKMQCHVQNWILWWLRHSCYEGDVCKLCCFRGSLASGKCSKEKHL